MKFYSDIESLIFVCGTGFLVLLLLYLPLHRIKLPVISNYPAYRFLCSLNYLFVKSLSLKEILILSRSTNDRLSFIKDYYDFKHKNIALIIKGISSVIILNFGVLVKNHFDMSLSSPIYNRDDKLLIMLTLLLLLFNIWYIIKLNDCVKEFKRAVKFYELLK
jgi:hypothetical protein